MLDDRFYVQRGPLTIEDIIEGLEVSLPDPKFLDETITYVESLADAKAGSLVYLGSKKSLKKLEGCKATACFVSEELSHHVGEQHIVPLITKYPRAHFARAMKKFAQEKTLQNAEGDAQISQTAAVHISAVIGAGAIIGENAVIGPNTVIGPGVSIGPNSVVEENVSIKAAVVDANCVIKAGAVIGGRGFGIDKDELGTIEIPHFGRVILGDGVQIGANSCVDRGQIGDTILGDNVKLDNLVQIGHNVEIGEGSRLAAQVGISGSCKVGRNVMMGGGVGMADHIEVGDNAAIAGRAGVMSDIPAGGYWGGTPAQPMKDFMREVAMARKLARKNKGESNEP